MSIRFKEFASPTAIFGCGIICTICVLCTMTANSQTFTTLVNFDGSNGAAPASLVQGLDGNLYGTTAEGGTNYGVGLSPGYGTIYKITPNGALTTVYNFCIQSGCPFDSNGLLLATNGNFYGTNGTFEMTKNGTVTSLNFDTTAIGFISQLVQAADGEFYGIGNGGTYNLGAFFKVTSGGAVNLLYSFCSQTNCTDGSYPSSLVQAANGNFYGTTGGGGTSSTCDAFSVGCGTIFKVTPGGTLTQLHSFDYTDGFAPTGLIQATDGNFYGITVGGGAYGPGTVFKITPGGTLTTLHSFNYFDGSNPEAGLIEATDGNFYGTTSVGGANAGGLNGPGTIFKVAPDGTLTTLHNFDSTDGANTIGELLQATDGNFYGATPHGGTVTCVDINGNSCGTVFSLSVGLGPFVKVLPTSGRVGSPVKILGTNLTGATSVSFHGKAATFAVVSASEISTKVPAGGTTGKIQVVTPSGTLTSNVVFRVTPVISGFSPSSGPAGTVVTISGESFTGASGVTFGGVKATSFTVNSYTQITATVPGGAITGKISVTTPGGNAASAGVFTVN